VTTRRVLLVAALAVAAAACRKSASESAQKAPVVDEAPVSALAGELRRELATATAVVLYAVDPLGDGARAAPEFHGYEIRKEVPIPPAEVATVMTAVTRSVGHGDVANCFDPHHALRVTTARGTLDLVICFGCAQLEAYRDEVRMGWETIGDAAEATLARYVGATPQDEQPW